MKRIMNYRPICVAALALIVGIAVTGVWAGLFWLRTTLCLVCATCAGVFIAVKLKKFAYIPLLVLVGVLATSGMLDIHNGKRINAESAEVSGVIVSEIEPYYNEYRMLLDNITIDGVETGKGAYVYVMELPSARAGESVTFHGNVEFYEFNYKDTVVLSRIRRGFCYEVHTAEIETAGEGNLGFFTRERLNIKKKLYAYTDGATTETVAALLFSDKFAISYERYENTVASGLAHVFAVSGLHVGFLAAAVTWLLKKLKVKGGYRLLATAAVLLFYGAFCEFPASVIRATVMCLTYVFASCTGKQNDALSTLSFSAILILILFPIDLFTLGFILSFASVFGIILLYKPIEKWLKFLPKYVRELTGVSIATNVAIYPIMANFFEEFQTLFMISNALLLPILPFIYVFSLFIVILVQLIPAAAPILAMLKVLTLPIKLVSLTIGSLAISTVSISPIGIIFSVLYYLLLILCSRFVFFDKKLKYIVGASLSTAAMILLTVAAFCA
jgi:ComEC/Rec2-related protein